MDLENSTTKDILEQLISRGSEIFTFTADELNNQDIIELLQDRQIVIMPKP